MQGDDRSRVQVAKLDLEKVNEALRKLSDWITRLEGRSGPINLRDSISLQTAKQTILDLESTESGSAALVQFGTENATVALAKGARKEDNGEWIATDTSATIFALTRAGEGNLYNNSGLTIGQAFEPTLAFTIGTGGSVASHALAGGSSPHTMSGLTAGHVLRATSATAFGFGTVDSAYFTGTNWTDLTDSGATTLHKHDHGGMDGLADDDHPQYVLNTGDTITGDVTLTTTVSNNTDQLLLETVENGNEGSGLLFRHDSASPAANDNLGHIRWAGRDSGASVATYVRTTGRIKSTTAGALYAEIEFCPRVNNDITSSGVLITGTTPTSTSPIAYIYAKPIALGLRADTVASFTYTGAHSYVWVFDAVDYDSTNSKLYLATAGGTANAGLYFAEAGYYRWSISVTAALAAGGARSVYVIRGSSSAVSEYLGMDSVTNEAGASRNIGHNISGANYFDAGDYLVVSPQTNNAPLDNNWGHLYIERIN